MLRQCSITSRGTARSESRVRFGAGPLQRENSPRAPAIHCPPEFRAGTTEQNSVWSRRNPTISRGQLRFAPELRNYRNVFRYDSRSAPGSVTIGPAFCSLLAPVDDVRFEEMAQKARALTRQNFGRTMRMFAPLYLSNECINNCRYCGFSRDNAILRVTLTVEEVVAEARHLAAQGFARCCWWPGNIRNLSMAATFLTASARLGRISRRSHSSSDRWRRRNMNRWSKPARKVWWFIRKLTIVASMPRCTPRVQTGFRLAA